MARVPVLLWITSLSGLVACTAPPAAGPTAPAASTATEVPSEDATPMTTATAVAAAHGSAASSASPWVPLVDLGAVGEDGTATAVIPKLPVPSSTPLTCSDAWFFSPAPAFCPDGLAESLTVAEQPFERGRMVWVPDESGAQVYVMFPGGQAESWADEWVEGQPETDPGIQPPAGLLQPRRGFGAVWRRVTGLRDRLGWALAPESAAQTRVQRERFGVDAKGWHVFLRLADGRVVQFIGHCATYAWKEAAR
jgi:hypothetical protein